MGLFNCNTCIRPSIIILLFLLLTALSLILFSLSLSQVKATARTDMYSLPPKFTSPSSLSSNSSSLLSMSHHELCTSADGYATHRPFRIRFGNDTQSVQCVWPYELSVPRIGGTILIAIASLFVIVGILLKWKLMMWVLIPMIFVLSVAFAVMGIIDAVQLSRATSWCHGRSGNSRMDGAKNPIPIGGDKHSLSMQPIVWTPFSIDYTCSHAQFIATNVFDWIVFLCGIVSCLIVLHMTLFKWTEFERRKGTLAAEIELELEEEELETMGGLSRQMNRVARRMTQFSPMNRNKS